MSFNNMDLQRLISAILTRSVSSLISTGKYNDVKAKKLINKIYKEYLDKIIESNKKELLK